MYAPRGLLLARTVVDTRWATPLAACLVRASHRAWFTPTWLSGEHRGTISGHRLVPSQVHEGIVSVSLTGAIRPFGLLSPKAPPWIRRRGSVVESARLLKGTKHDQPTTCRWVRSRSLARCGASRAPFEYGPRARTRRSHPKDQVPPQSCPRSILEPLCGAYVVLASRT